MTTSITPPEITSVIAHPRHAPKKRNLKKVPYVELWGGKVQGVVSSGSSATRVYVSWFEESGDYYCATNNNRRCGGLRGGGCKHIHAMIDQAMAQYGGDEVARYLGVEGDPGTFSRSYDITRQLHGSERKEQASEVFARFLNYLRYMELVADRDPMPEMAFFVTGG
ncbi:MAG: hypothetical protein AAFX99_04420 [Myxococcota bacterium]